MYKRKEPANSTNILLLNFRTMIQLDILVLLDEMERLPYF
jgi:hypothetical protein